MTSAVSADKSSKQRRSDEVAAEPCCGEPKVRDEAGLRLQMPGFEGPLDLLLHLIREHELDIINIPIAFVTEKYLQYLGLMQQLNIDVAGDYLVMAATLAHIKSRLLLPSPPVEDDADLDEDELDPRADLIRRLLEYQKYKQVAEELAQRSVLGRDVFPRGAALEAAQGPAPLEPVGLFQLLDAFQRLLDRAKTVLDHEVEFERLSITERINQLVDMLRGTAQLSFDDLFAGQCTKVELVVTFLALLEMTRLRLTKLHQDGTLGPIMVELAVVEDGPTGATSELSPDAAEPVLGSTESATSASEPELP
jgi:segregation and condensation protein A